MVLPSTSPFTAGPTHSQGWEVAWLESPHVVVLGVFDHVVDTDGCTDFEQLETPIRWPDEVVKAFLPAAKKWIIDMPDVFFRPLVGPRLWSPERKRVRQMGARWRRSLGGRITASLPPGLSESRLKPFTYAIAGPDTIVSWVFVSTAEVKLNVVSEWIHHARDNATTILDGPCERILALQDGHVFVAVAASQKTELQECLNQTARELTLPVAQGRTLLTSPVR